MTHTDAPPRYDVNLVETLVRFAWANPGSAVGAHGWMSRPGLNLTAQKNQSHLQDHGWTDPIWKVPMGPVPAYRRSS